jgi:hypothetical protein
VTDDKILLIGSGRLAKHLHFYFQSLGLALLTWSRSDGVDPLLQKLKLAKYVALAISDDSLSDFFDKHLKNLSIKTFHFSGAYHHPKILSFHPLMTFSNELYDIEFYKKIHFAVSDLQEFKNIFQKLPNPTFQLSAENKALYHAWAVLLGAGTQNHLKSGMNALLNIGVPKDASLLYIQKVFEQFINHKGQSITGPWVRDDQTTIEKNLNALQSQDQILYENLMERTSK